MQSVTSGIDDVEEHVLVISPGPEPSGDMTAHKFTTSWPRFRSQKSK